MPRAIDRTVLADLRLAVEVVATRLRVEHRLRTLPLDRAVERLTPDTVAAGSIDDHDAMARVERWTRTLLRNRRVPRTTCLHRALTRYVLLRRRGVDAHFVMGLVDRPGVVEGHAWVTVSGAAVMEPTPPDFTTTFEYPAPCPTSESSP